MSNLPEKPEAVAHVSDAHWEAATRQVWAEFRELDPRLFVFERVHWDVYQQRKIVADWARRLILLGEVPEPVDPITLAASHIWHVANGPHCDAAPRIEAAIREYLAGVTIPTSAQSAEQ